MKSPEVLRAIAGGMLIGAGSATLLLLNGRVAGVSGILGNVIRESFGEQGWRLAFLLGLLIPALFLGVSALHLPPHWLWAIASGLLVGAGTQIGSGCTSGHGVCGLANLSTRSLVATLVFMSAAMVTVFIVRHAGPS
ncbi:MAG TPA: YeeE/YedE family protein [Steroidobacteraceae bacterium]